MNVQHRQTHTSLGPEQDSRPDNCAEFTATPRLTLESRSRKWTLRVVALLMILQAAGLAFMTVVYVSQVNWIRERALSGLSSTAVDTLLFSILSIPLVLFATRAVMGLIRIRKGAWLQSMTIQALLLVFALSSYVLDVANSLTFWTLVSCIIVVLYLNTHEVRSSFSADALGKDDPTELFGDDEELVTESQPALNSVRETEPVNEEGADDGQESTRIDSAASSSQDVSAALPHTIPNSSTIDKTAIDRTPNHHTANDKTP